MDASVAAVSDGGARVVGAAASRTRRERENDDARRTARALRLVYGVLLPRMRRASEALPGVLGYSRPSMARACVRNHEFYLAMAAQLGERWELLVAELESTSVSESWRRIEREHMEEAALELVRVVRALPAPLREVTELRACGAGWREVSRALPGRVYWSVVEDWDRALKYVWVYHGDLVRRLV